MGVILARFLSGIAPQTAGEIINSIDRQNYGWIIGAYFAHSVAYIHFDDRCYYVGSITLHCFVLHGRCGDIRRLQSAWKIAINGEKTAIPANSNEETPIVRRRFLFFCVIVVASNFGIFIINHNMCA